MTVNIKRIRLSNASIFLISDEESYKLKDIVLAIPSRDQNSSKSIQFFPEFSQNFISKIIAEQISLILNESILLIGNLSSPSESLARKIISKIKESDYEE